MNGNWGQWSSAWSACSKTCGDGVRTKTRQCNNPAPLHGGIDCSGNSAETQACKEKDCPGRNYCFNSSYVQVTFCLTIRV